MGEAGYEDDESPTRLVEWDQERVEKRWVGRSSWPRREAGVGWMGVRWRLKMSVSILADLMNSDRSFPFANKIMPTNIYIFIKYIK